MRLTLAVLIPESNPAPDAAELGADAPDSVVFRMLGTFAVTSAQGLSQGRH